MAVLAGTTTMAGSNTFFGDGDSAGSPFVAVASGTAESMSMGIRVSNWTNIWLAIYADNAGTQGALLGQTVAIPDPGDATVITGAMAAAVDIVSGTTYWLQFLLDGASSLNITYSGGSAGMKGKNGLGTSFPDPWDPSGGFTDATNTLAIQVDGTEGGGGSEDDQFVKVGGLWTPSDRKARAGGVWV